MRYADLKELDADKLHKELADKLSELEQLRFAQASGSLKQNHKFEVVKRDIARIKTVLSQK